MKIIGFAQMHNELSNGNLHNWFKSMEVCDYIYIYDQGSTDVSDFVYKSHSNTKVIYSPINDFSNELRCKQLLLEAILTDHPDTDWIFWLDGDTILDGRLTYTSLRQFLTSVDPKTNGLYFGHYNLWRSDVHYRVDDQYDSLNGWVIPFWRVVPGMRFNVEEGLHKSQFPITVQPVSRVPFALIHRGFATAEGIVRKYRTYKARGQRGWDLNRLLSEKGLTVAMLPREIIPSWLTLTDTVSPLEKRPLVEIEAIEE